MADVSHANLTGASLHEPKGVAAASSNTVYVANGAGSGAWSVYPEVLALNVDIDIHVSGTQYLALPIAGVITKIYSVLNGSTGTGSATIAFSNNGSAVTSGDITIDNTDAAGIIDSSTPSANNTTAAGTYLACTNTPSGTGAGRTARLTVLIRRTA